MKKFILLILLLISTNSHAYLTIHFQNWLKANKYPLYQFLRLDVEGGSFGGKRNELTPIKRQPVIFIHGNSDRAIGGLMRGWKKSRAYFLKKGYSDAELYAITWGQANPMLSLYTRHSQLNVEIISLFIEAVSNYTQSKVDVIAHSHGVTLARGAILRNNLGEKIDTFIGIAGGNKGVPICHSPTHAFALICNLYDGISPYSLYIQEINQKVGYEGKYRYSIWSPIDEIVGNGCMSLPGIATCRLPGQTGELIKLTSHLGTRDKTTEVQYKMINQLYK